MRLLEVCVDNLDSAMTAWKAGAHRLEICKDLSVGGVTPTAELVSVIKKSVSIPVFVIIRLRPGNFHYTVSEVEKMLEEIQTMKNLGVNGLVFGALDKDGNVDISVCQQVLAVATGIPVTFHRAFDEVVNKSWALEDIIELGFERILTTGGPETAVEGIHELKNLILQADSRLIIMPGGGVTDSNILMILEATKATEFHSSGRVSDPDSPTSKSKICSEKVTFAIEKLNTIGAWRSSTEYAIDATVHKETY